MESFTICPLSAIVDHIISYYFPRQFFAKRLGMTCNLHQNVFILPVSFTGSYTGDEPNVSRQNNLILQKKVSGVDKVVNFNDFSRTLTEFKDFSRLYKPRFVLDQISFFC